VAPGVIDTGMQLQLRSASDVEFPDRAGFSSLHAQGRLSQPDDAARRLLAFLERPEFGKEPVADVRD
jgi:NAD(P)-dependent dehydrogenase (short-subunit alcohol dehydrogenase family)